MTSQGGTSTARARRRAHPVRNPIVVSGAPATRSETSQSPNGATQAPGTPSLHVLRTP